MHTAMTEALKRFTYCEVKADWAVHMDDLHPAVRTLPPAHSDAREPPTPRLTTVLPLHLVARCCLDSDAHESPSTMMSVALQLLKLRAAKRAARQRAAFMVTTRPHC